MTKNSNTTICFIGGDERQTHAAANLSEYININVVGDVFKKELCANTNFFDNPLKAIYGSDVIILPMPAAMSENILPFSELIKHSAGRRILGGKFSPYFKGILENTTVKYKDYYEDECFTVKNAFLTAEGAINLAMSSIKGSLRLSKCAIIGYGRIGKALGSMLRAFNSDVTVWARREETLALAAENGLRSTKISANNALSELSEDFDIIFNTVPERIISNETLLAIPSKTVLIELASLPGGFDPDIASQCELKFVDGKGLPGKYAPMAAGKILSETIIHYLQQEEIL